MNKSIINVLFTVFLLASSLTFGQSKKDKIKSLKVAFMTERLDLSSKEAQEFWPLYNKYEEDRNDLRRKQHEEIRTKIKNVNDISEKEAKELLDRYLRYEQDEEKVEKQFLESVSKVISARKTMLLLRSEEEFKKELIKRYHERRGNR